MVGSCQGSRVKPNEAETGGRPRACLKIFMLMISVVAHWQWHCLHVCARQRASRAVAYSLFGVGRVAGRDCHCGLIRAPFPHCAAAHLSEQFRSRRRSSRRCTLYSASPRARARRLCSWLWVTASRMPSLRFRHGTSERLGAPAVCWAPRSQPPRRRKMALTPLHVVGTGTTAATVPHASACATISSVHLHVGHASSDMCQSYLV